MLMKQTNSKSFLLNQDIKESGRAIDFKHMAYTIAEKALNFFVSQQMYKLKRNLLEKLLMAYEADTDRISASEVSQVIC